MRRVIFAWWFAFITTNGSAQTLSHSIVYEVKTLNKGISFNGEPVFSFTGRLIFNDTFSFFYMSRYRQDVYKKTVGEKFFHHAYIRKPFEDFSASGINYKVKQPVLMPDSSRFLNWMPGNSKKTIIGYDCMMAIAVSDYNDSTLAYYTTELPPQYGPAWFSGLPGTILEVYDQRSNRHFIASKVTVGDVKLTLPENIIIMSKDEFLKNTTIRKAIRDKFTGH